MAKFSKKSDFFFDLDHTLWDFEKNSDLTFKKIFGMHGISVDLDSFLLKYKPINFNYWKEYRNQKITKERLRFARLEDTFNSLDVDMESKKIKMISEDYIKYLTTFNHLFEGTTQVLDYLSSKYNLHIITNGFEEVQTLKLERSGISRYFQTTTTSEMAGVKKPSPKIFELALLNAGARIKSSIMIGDNLEADILGAKNIGMDSIIFNYHDDIPDGIISIKKLTELLDYF